MKSSILKNASGLVKQARAIDVFIFNIGLISVGIAINLIYYYVPQNYLGANIPISILLSAVFIALIAFNFWCWAVAIPRSGGAYSFVTRSISPIIGFSVSFIDSIVWLFYNSLACTYLVYLGISPLFFSVGYKLNNQFLIELSIKIQLPICQLFIGVISIIISGLILIQGMKYFFTFQKIIFSLAIIGTLTTIIVLYEDNTNNLSEIIGTLEINNLQVSEYSQSIFSTRMTVFAAVWPILSFVGSIFSVNISSEIQNVNKSQLWGMFGSIVVSSFILYVLSHGYNNLVPVEIQILLNKAYQENHQLKIAPYFSLIVSLLSNSVVYSIIICTGFFCWAFLWLPATLAYCSRALLAWSFDRIVPSSLSKVHDNKFTPVNAIVTVVIVNTLLLILYIYVPFFNSLVLVLAAMIAWLPITFSAIIFPFTRKRLYLQTPISKYNILKIPLITISGVLGFISNIVLVYFLLNDEVAAGHSVYSIGTVIVLFLIATIWYYIAKTNINKKDGLDISKSFQEIPID